jgi:cell division protein FtsW (lipid II flippase)
LRFADDGVVAIHRQGRERGSPLDLAGFMNFQPSELAKFATVLYAADYMVRRWTKERFFRAVIPMAIAIGITPLLLAERGHVCLPW